MWVRFLHAGPNKEFKMKEVFRSVLNWMKERFNDMEEASLCTADFVDGSIGPFG
jgi:hypothetical protein